MLHLKIIYQQISSKTPIWYYFYIFHTYDVAWLFYISNI